MSNLTTLAAVKAYLSITTANQDALITSLIPRESSHAENWTGRVFPSVTHSGKRLNGSGTSRLVLPDNPILSISALSISGSAVSASSDGVQAGYLFDETCIYLVGGQTFPMGNQNVQCSWVAGYQESETDFIPTGNTPTLTPLTGGTAQTVISVYDNTSSVALTAVGDAPATGEYSFDEGVFTFNLAQYNHSVTMTYYYVPSPVEQAVIELIGLDLQQRTNIGMNSKSIGGESISYTTKAMTPSAQELLQPYRRMVTA